jgi:ubiquinone/menaquinone biosynthesis C-methylase UbiE
MKNDSSGVGVGLGPSDYAMGFTDRERERLMLQGRVMREMTAAGFRAAGIATGMRVLDLGCGVGEVAILAADLVGPSGSVVGLDRDAASVAWATRRAAEAGRTNIRFQAGEFSDFADERPFDALIGRFILLYLPDPGAMLRKLSERLRPGAVVAFFEGDITVPARLEPEIPLLRKCYIWMKEALRHSGACLDMGMRLYQSYLQAGFVNSGCLVSHLSGCGPRPGLNEFVAETIRSLLPKIEQYGIATREEVDIDTLAERLDAAVRAVNLQWVGPPYITAWATRP